MTPYGLQVSVKAAEDRQIEGRWTKAEFTARQVMEGLKRWATALKEEFVPVPVTSAEQLTVEAQVSYTTMGMRSKDKISLKFEKGERMESDVSSPSQLLTKF
jgi:hypothetical protein